MRQPIRGFNLSLPRWAVFVLMLGALVLFAQTAVLSLLGVGGIKGYAKTFISYFVPLAMVFTVVRQRRQVTCIPSGIVVVQAAGSFSHGATSAALKSNLRPFSGCPACWCTATPTSPLCASTCFCSPPNSAKHCKPSSAAIFRQPEHALANCCAAQTAKGVSHTPFFTPAAYLLK